MCFNGDEDFAAYAHWLKEFADKYENALGKESSLRTPHNEYLQLGATEEERKKNYQALFQYHLDTSVLNAIRTSVSQGLALGDNRFKLQIEENYKRRVTPRTAGRKPT